MVAADQHIGWLDVSMDNAVLMRIGESLGDLKRDRNGFGEREAGAGLNPREKIRALKKFHDNKLSALILFNGKDRDDVFMLETSHCAGFAQKSFEEREVAGQV